MSTQPEWGNLDLEGDTADADGGLDKDHIIAGLEDIFGAGVGKDEDINQGPSVSLEDAKRSADLAHAEVRAAAREVYAGAFRGALGVEAGVALPGPGDGPEDPFAGTDFGFDEAAWEADGKAIEATGDAIARAKTDVFGEVIDVDFTAVPPQNTTSNGNETDDEEAA